MSKVLVTGATGYIGSHVVKLLAEMGHEVYGIDVNFHGEHNNVEKYCSLKLQDITWDIKYRSEYDAVVHLAGRSVVPQSLIEPSEYYRVNTIGTNNLFNHIDTPHIIFASTSSAFEMASPYARSKVAA